MTSPLFTRSPSSMFVVNSELGSIIANVASANASPATMPSAFITNRARPRSPGSKIASLVMSGRSSSSARRTMASTASRLRGCEETHGGPDCERDDANCEARRRDDAGTSWRRRNEAGGVVPPQDGPPWISSQPLSMAPPYRRNSASGLPVYPGAKRRIWRFGELLTLRSFDGSALSEAWTVHRERSEGSDGLAMLSDSPDPSLRSG
jgi:hypothetical protein